MDRFLSILTALVLALVLALGSVSMAVARGGMSPLGTMILCLDATEAVVPLGPDGMPNDAMPVCPDCTMVELALPEPAAMAVPVAATQIAEPSAHVASHPRSFLQGGQGRGPPILI